MNININLKDAVVYIPSGRMMNVKKSLGWDNLVLSKEDILKQISFVRREKYSLDINFGTNYTGSDFMEKYKNDRTAFYKKILNDNVGDLKFFNIENFVKNTTNLLQEASSMVQSNPLIQKKLEKLNKLKLINS